MKTIIVLCALVSLGLSAPALPEDLQEKTSHTSVQHGPALSTVSDVLKRDKKSPTEAHNVPTLTETVNTETDAASPTGRSFVIKKPLIVKKKYGYQIYRDSEEERANADSHESCGRQVKVKLCDEDGKFRHMLKNSMDDSHHIHSTEDDVKQSIKMAKEAVENLQKDLKRMEHNGAMKLAHESEADKDLHEDIEKAREALQHIHENFGNLDAVTFHSTSTVDPESTNDVHVAVARTQDERMTQWKDALENIQKYVEIAKNIEDSFKSANNQENLLTDQSENAPITDEHKIEVNMDSHVPLTAESHVRSSEHTTSEMQNTKDINSGNEDKNINDVSSGHEAREEPNIEDDMKPSASDVNEVSEMKILAPNNKHLLRNSHHDIEDTLGNKESGIDHSPKEKSSEKNIDQMEDLAELPQNFDDEKENIFKSEIENQPSFKSHENIEGASLPDVHEKRSGESHEKPENHLQKEKNTLETTADPAEALEKSVEDFEPSLDEIIPNHDKSAEDLQDMEAKESVQAESLQSKVETVTSPSVKSAEQKDQTGSHIPEQEMSSIKTKAAELHKEPQKHDHIGEAAELTSAELLAALKSVEDPLFNDDTTLHVNNAFVPETSQSKEIPLMKNAEENNQDLHRNLHAHELTLLQSSEDSNNLPLNHMRHSHLVEQHTPTKSSEGHTTHFHNENLRNTPFEELPMKHIDQMRSQNWAEHPSMRATEDHPKNIHMDLPKNAHLAEEHTSKNGDNFHRDSHLDHLRHSHIGHPSMKNFEDHINRFHPEHFRNTHLADMHAMNGGDFGNDPHIEQMRHSHMTDLHSMPIGDGFNNNMEMLHGPSHMQSHPTRLHHNSKAHNKFNEMNGMGMPHNLHPSMRDAMEGFGSESVFRWQPVHESARTAYGSGLSSSSGSSSGGGAVGLFPNANGGACGIPLLLSCSPSVVSGSLAKPHVAASSYSAAAPAYSAPSYRTEDEFGFHNKRDIMKNNELRTSNAVRMSPIIKQKTGKLLETNL